MDTAARERIDVDVVEGRPLCRHYGGVRRCVFADDGDLHLRPVADLVNPCWKQVHVSPSPVPCESIYKLLFAVNASTGHTSSGSTRTSRQMALDRKSTRLNSSHQ